MSIAGNFMNLFFEQHPQAMSGELGLEELSRLMAEFQHKVNNTPNDDFDGLSPAQMDILLRAPLSDSCILRFNKSMDPYLEQVPLFW